MQEVYGSAREPCGTSFAHSYSEEPVRTIPFLLYALCLLYPGTASGQSFLLEASAGPTVVDAGYGVSAGVGFMPASRVALSFELERTHLSSRLRTDGRGSISGFRGGTLTLASGELRVGLFGRDRIGPYGLAGFAAGVSRPNVNEMFPDSVTNDVRAVFFGGGIHVPVKERFSLFADARMMLGAEAGDLLAVAPIRAGVAWHF
jgi:hypothetical protein